MNHGREVWARHLPAEGAAGRVAGADEREPGSSIRGRGTDPRFYPEPGRNHQQ